MGCWLEPAASGSPRSQRTPSLAPSRTLGQPGPVRVRGQVSLTLSLPNPNLPHPSPSLISTVIPTRAFILARTRQWTIREVLQGREVPTSNEEARTRMGNYPTKWHASMPEPAGPALGQRALQRPLSHQPERAAGCLRLRRASAHEPLWSQPSRSHAGRPPRACLVCGPGTSRLCGGCRSRR